MRSLYRGNPQAPPNCVRHEQCAWDILARHGVRTPEVVLVANDSHNVFGRPFVITRALTGTLLTALLGYATEAEQRQLLGATGDYLRRMHTISFTHPGYLMRSDGPAAPPTRNRKRLAPTLEGSGSPGCRPRRPAGRSNRSHPVGRWLSTRRATEAQLGGFEFSKNMLAGTRQSSVGPSSRTPEAIDPSKIEGIRMMRR
jgi:hypothetical protein